MILLILVKLITFIVIYLLADKISNYTMLSKYIWFDNLSINLHFYKGKYKKILSYIYYSKIFTCKSCNVFWISLTIYSIISLFFVIDPLTYSLLIFLIHKIENQNV